MKSTIIALLAALSVGACASTPRQPAGPPPLDPVGNFDFSTSAQGTDVTGTISITRGQSGLGGTISTSATEPIPIRSVVVEGQVMRITADTPDGPLNMTVTFTGNDFTGGWNLGDAMSGQLTGKRRTT